MNIIVTTLQKLPLLLLLVLSAASVVTGDYFAKYWSIHTRNIFFVLALICYIGSSVFYIPTLLKEGLIVTSLIWSVLSIIGFLAVGFFVFKETLSTRETIGVILGVASLLILNIKK